jgi:hypothetical protein
VIDVDPDVIYFRDDTDLDDRTLAALKDLATVARFVGVSDPPNRLNAAHRNELERMLLADPSIEQPGRYRWDIGGRTVDFSWILANGGRFEAEVRG